MKIFKLNQYKDALNRMIVEFKREGADISYLRNLQDAVAFNKELSEDQLGCLYLMAAINEQLHRDVEPKVVVTTMDAIKENQLENLESNFVSKLYEEIKQNLYITYLLTKPNGEKFGQGSLEFTAEEYEEMHSTILKELEILMRENEKYLGISIMEGRRYD